MKATIFLLITLLILSGTRTLATTTSQQTQADSLRYFYVSFWAIDEVSGKMIGQYAFGSPVLHKETFIKRIDNLYSGQFNRRLYRITIIGILEFKNKAELDAFIKE